MRYLEAENPYIIARFTTGDTVKITVYKLSDNTKTVDDVAMTEIGSTGYFKYQFNPSPAALTEYLYISNNTIEEHAGKIILGGYPDGIKDQTDKLNFTGDDVKATLDSEEVATDTASRNASKATGFSTHSAADVKTEMEGAGTKLTDVKDQTDKMNFSGDNIQSRIADKGVLNNPTKEQIADQVWDEDKEEHLSDGSVGSYLTLLFNRISVIDTGDSINYKKIKELLNTAIAQVPKLPEMPSLNPLTEKINDVQNSVNNIKIPEQAGKIDLSGVIENIDELHHRIKNIPKPIKPEKVDLSSLTTGIGTNQSKIENLEKTMNSVDKMFQDMKITLTNIDKKANKGDNKPIFNFTKKPIVFIKPKKKQLTKKRKWL